MCVIFFPQLVHSFY